MTLPLELNLVITSSLPNVNLAIENKGQCERIETQMYEDQDDVVIADRDVMTTLSSFSLSCPIIIRKGLMA